MVSKKIIFIVDDEDSILLSLQRILELSGEYEIITSKDGNEALKKIKRTIPDLIISDIMMPGMDGLDFCRKIRKNEITRNVPFIFLTAKREKMIDGFKAGGDDFIIKPFTFDEVIVKIEAIFRRVEQTQEQANQIKGQIKEFGLDQILKICSKKSITGTVILQQKGTVGEIEIERGEISKVSLNDMSENDALDEIRSWTAGIFIIRPIGIKLRPEFLAAYAKEKPSYQLDDAIEITTDTWWVGRRNSKTLLQGNVYLRRFSKEEKVINYLIGAGSPADFPDISTKVTSIIGGISKINLYGLHNSNPDVCMNALYFRNANARAICMTSEDNWGQIAHYEINPKSVKLINSFKDGLAPLATGHKVQFIFTPFCSSRGSFMTYDPEMQVLFSGNLFSGLDSGSQEPRLYAKEEDWDGIRTFHQMYMPSSKAVKLAIDKLRALDPQPLIIAPQHGMILRGKLIEDFMERLYFLDTGADLLQSTESEELFASYTEACNLFIEECTSHISNESIQQKIDSDTQLLSGVSFKSGKIKKIFHKPSAIFEQLIMTITENEKAAVANQLKSFALKLVHARGLPAPYFTWDSDPTLTGTNTQLFDNSES